MIKLINEYKTNPDLVYQTWFVNNETRLKAFRTIRRGVIQVIEDIKAERFPNDFKGSSLEFVISCISEQKQVFEGASHPFYWKPKLRIPDIYENQNNKKQFGQFLEKCMNATKESAIIDEIIRLDRKRIKGLGPAVANILYFLHPTIIPPFNTAIVNGFNLLFNDKVKLGSWPEFLRMRDVILSKNKEYSIEFSNDLGAFCGMLFEVGAKNIMIETTEYMNDNEREKLLKKIQRRHKKVTDECEENELHNEMQYHLLKVGKELGYDVIAANNDLSKSYNDNSFSFLSLEKFPRLNVEPDVQKTICLIDVIWFKKETDKIVCAFEVEKSTSIYSGILRLSDLSYSLPSDNSKLYIVAPDEREKEVKLQLNRPTIKNASIEIKYILFNELRENCDALCKFGENYEILEKIAKMV